MGQYYRPVVILDNGENNTVSTNSWDFHNGAKLMEHSYVGNHFVAMGMYLISLCDKGDGVTFVWAGDYADNADGKEDNWYGIARENEDNGVNEDTVIEAKELLASNGDGIVNPFKYIINHTTKQFVEVGEFENNKWKLHPLPLLTADGNGRGMGDYSGKKNAKSVGAWAYSRISVGNEVPDGYTKYNKWKTEYEE